MTVTIGRRKLLVALGGAAAWPLAARAQQPAVPVIGFLDLRSPEALTDRLREFRQGLRESSYVEGDNVTVVQSTTKAKLFIVLRQGIRVGQHAGPSTGLSHQVGGRCIANAN